MSPSEPATLQQHNHILQQNEEIFLNPPGFNESESLQEPPEFVEPSWVLSGNGGPLGEYDWSLSSRSHNSAGQEYGAQGNRASNEVQPWREEEDEEQQAGQLTVNSIPINDDIIPGPEPEDAEMSEPESHMATPPEDLRCDECDKTFEKRHLFNKHHKQHHPTFVCPVDQCHQLFRYNKDLVRHRNDKHPETVPGGPVRWFCPVPECKYSIGRGSGFPRPDNFRRHVRGQHPWIAL